MTSVSAKQRELAWNQKPCAILTLAPPGAEATMLQASTEDSQVPSCASGAPNEHQGKEL